MQNLLEKLGLGERATSMVVWVGLSVLLLVIVIALAVWLVRTLRPSLNMSGAQGRGGRPQRLAITDAFNLDREGRRLVIVRRDNVEHLLLIGGPNDVVVESSIVRGERILRDRGGRIISEADAALAAEAGLTTELTRAEPAAPAPVAPPAPPAPVARPMPPAPPGVQIRASAPQPAPQSAPPVPRLDDDFERAIAAMPIPAPRPAPHPAPPPAPQPVSPPPAPPRAPAPPAPPPAPPAAPLIAEAPQPAAVTPPPPPPPPAPPRQEPVSEMARRLNEVLQKPLSGTLRAPFNKPIPPVPATMNSAPRPPEPVAPPPLPVQHAAPLPPPIPELPPAPPPMPAAPTGGAKTASTELEMDLLEEEMARLLGRPGQQTKPGAS